MEDHRIEELTQTIQKIYSNKEIVKGLNEETKLLIEKAEDLFTESEAAEIVIPLSEDQVVVITPNLKTKSTLDKEALAHALHIDKSDMKTPWDFAKLAEKLAKEQDISMATAIARHTKNEQIIKPKMKKRNVLKKEKKKESFAR